MHHGASVYLFKFHVVFCRPFNSVLSILSLKLKQTINYGHWLVQLSTDRQSFIYFLCFSPEYPLANHVSILTKEYGFYHEVSDVMSFCFCTWYVQIYMCVRVFVLLGVDMRVCCDIKHMCRNVIFAPWYTFRFPLICLCVPYELSGPFTDIHRL